MSKRQDGENSSLPREPSVLAPSEPQLGIDDISPGDSLNANSSTGADSEAPARPSAGNASHRHGRRRSSQGDANPGVVWRAPRLINPWILLGIAVLAFLAGIIVSNLVLSGFLDSLV